jgi:RNA polymerase sigma-70 factor, ECF subfamily
MALHSIMYNYTDEELMLTALNGNESAFNILYTRFNSRLYHYLLYRLCGDPTHVDDIFMDVWERILKARKKVLEAYNRAPAEFKFTCYLFRVAHNRVIDEGRKPKPPMVPYDPYEDNPPQHDPYEDNPQPKESPDPEPAGLEVFVESEQMTNAALEALGQLPKNQREAFLLYVIGMTVPEIAEITDADEEAVKSRIRYARNKLKELLKG